MPAHCFTTRQWVEPHVTLSLMGGAACHSITHWVVCMLQQVWAVAAGQAVSPAVGGTCSWITTATASCRSCEAPVGGRSGQAATQREAAAAADVAAAVAADAAALRAGRRGSCRRRVACGCRRGANLLRRGRGPAGCVPC
eukprot:364585-Chlamydomonas_euryale.AAC.18